MLLELEPMKQTEKIAVFEQIHTQYSTLLESVIWRLTGNRDQFAEAYQNALLALWQHIEKLQQDRAGGYIYRIALSAASKTWKNQPGHSLIHGECEMSQDALPEDQLIFRENSVALRRSILNLPEKQAQAVTMRYLQGKAYAQIAKEMQCNESGARAHVSRAIARLKAVMVRNSVQEAKNE